MKFITTFLGLGFLVISIGVTACLSWVIVLVIKDLKSLFEDIKSHNRNE